MQREHCGRNAADAAGHGRYRADDRLRRVKVHVAGEAVLALRPAYADVDNGLILAEILRAEKLRFAYGGNDSDFDWDAIQERPEEEHIPRTALPEFRSTLLSMLEKLRDQSVQPVLMTLPPIDAQRYLDFLCRAGRSKERIMAWLGDIQHIYRHQELYSDTVAQVAYETGTPIIRVRESFLREKHLPGLISPDGIHLTMEGYTKMFDTLAGWLRQAIA